MSRNVGIMGEPGGPIAYLASNGIAPPASLIRKEL